MTRTEPVPLRRSPRIRPALPALLAVAIPGLVLTAALAGRLALAWRGGAGTAWDATILAVLAAWRNGQALHPAQDEASFYAVPYGPALFEMLAIFQDLASPPGLPLPALVAMASALWAPLTWLGLRSSGMPASGALAILAAVTAADLTFFYGGVRGDGPLLVLAACGVALSARLQRGSYAAALAVGVAAGLATAMKVSAPAYFLPVAVAALCAPLPVPCRLRLAAVGCAAAVVACFLAYLPSGSSIPDHIDHLLVIRYPASMPGLRAMAGQLPLLMLPLVAMARSRRQRHLAAGLLLGLVPVVWAGAIPGAGTYHLVPFLPTTALMLGEAWMSLPAGRPLLRNLVVGAGLAAFLAATALAAHRFRLQWEGWRPIESVIDARIAGFVATHPGKAIVILALPWGPPLAPEAEEVARALRRNIHLPALSGGRLWFTDSSWVDQVGAARELALTEALARPDRAEIILMPPDGFGRGGRLSPSFWAGMALHFAPIATNEPFEVWVRRQGDPPTALH